MVRVEYGNGDKLWAIAVDFEFLNFISAKSTHANSGLAPHNAEPFDFPRVIVVTADHSRLR